MTTNRLDFFRQQIAAFEAASDPKEAIKKGYYIEQPRNSLANTIATKMILRPSSRHLLIGGIGSGKTTQLLMTYDKLNEVKDISAHYVDVSLYTDISEIQSGSLLAIAGLIFSKMLSNQEKIKEIENAVNIIESYAYRTQELEYFGINLQDKINQYSGVLSLESTQQSIYQKVYDSLKKIKNYISEEKKFFVLLFDGLDRFNNNQFMLNIIDSDIELISKLGIGIILVGSISLNYSNYQDTLKQKFSNNICYQPYFSVINDANAYEFFDNVLKKRSPEKFISDAARKILITYSGGVLRDLINLTQNSIEEAYLNDSDTIQKSHVNAAVEAYGQTKIFGVSNSELKILTKVAKGETFLPRTDEHIHLLVNQSILEYHHPKKRYAVHPVLLPLISQPLA